MAFRFAALVCALLAVQSATAIRFHLRGLKAYAGTPAQLASEHPELSAVLNVIQALNVLPDGQIDAGITIFAPNNGAISSLFNSLGQTVPSSADATATFLNSLGPVKNGLITAILYNIAPEIVELPSSGSETIPTLLQGQTITAQGSGGKTTLTTPGNTSPVNVVNQFDWNGARIIVTDQVLQPSTLGQLLTQPTTPQQATAIITALRGSIGAAPGGAPMMAPAKAPSAAMSG